VTTDIRRAMVARRLETLSETGTMAKATLKTRRNNGSVGAFLNKLADPVQRADSLVVLEMMQQATKAEPKMWGPAIIGFGGQMLKYASGRELEWPVLAFSPRKGNLTLYILNGAKRQQLLLGKLGKHSTGKVCLYIKRLSDVDLGVLKELITESVAQVSRTK
jgi:hypothetical protein